jgi:hypothetical protein
MRSRKLSVTSPKPELFAEIERLRVEETRLLDEVRRLLAQLAELYSRTTLEAVALTERIAELEAAVREAAPVVKRGAKLEEENTDLRRYISELEAKAPWALGEYDKLSAHVAALDERIEKPERALARRRKGKVSEKKPYRQLILSDEALRHDLRTADDPVKMAMAYLKERGITRHPKRRAFKSWLVKAGLIPS